MTKNDSKSQKKQNINQLKQNVTIPLETSRKTVNSTQHLSLTLKENG